MEEYETSDNRSMNKRSVQTGRRHVPSVRLSVCVLRTDSGLHSPSHAQFSPTTDCRAVLFAPLIALFIHNGGGGGFYARIALDAAARYDNRNYTTTTTTLPVLRPLFQDNLGTPLQEW